MNTDKTVMRNVDFILINFSYIHYSSRETRGMQLQIQIQAQIQIQLQIQTKILRQLQTQIQLQIQIQIQIRLTLSYIRCSSGGTQTPPSDDWE